MSGAGRPGRRRSGGTGRRAGLKIPCPQGREGSTPSSGTTPFPVAWCATGGGRTGEGRPTPRRIALPGVPTTADNTFHDRHEGHRAVSEEERDALERGRSEPRRKGRPTPVHDAVPGVPRNEHPEGHSHGWAAPLPNVLRSLGYPATNSPRGKAQAGDSPRPPTSNPARRGDIAGQGPAGGAYSGGRLATTCPLESMTVSGSKDLWR